MNTQSLQNVLALAHMALRGQSVNQPPGVMAGLWADVDSISKDHAALAKAEADKAAEKPSPAG